MLRDRLRALGYKARLVNGDCCDIDQGGITHYLSNAEAEALCDAGPGVDLFAHSERRGLNRWYDFSATPEAHQ
jgi:hypothetical protein